MTPEQSARRLTKARRELETLYAEKARNGDRPCCQDCAERIVYLEAEVAHLERLAS